jgi:hypothetical protein
MIERLPVLPPDVKEVMDLISSFRSENSDLFASFVDGTVLEAPASLEKVLDRV